MHSLSKFSIQYEEYFQERIEKTSKLLEKYLCEQSEKNIHDIRKSIRRLDANVMLLPKKIRQKNKVQEMIKSYKNFFKLNSVLRDYDVIEKKLFSHKVEFLLKQINKKRLINSKESLSVAKQIHKLKMPKISSDELNESKILKRFFKLRNNLLDRIHENTMLVISDEKKIDELHELRKDCKKLRYILEIPINDERELVSELSQMQDLLGDIHDNDITIEFLKKYGKNKIKTILENQLVERMENYKKFVQFISKK